MITNYKVQDARPVYLDAKETTSLTKSGTMSSLEGAAKKSIEQTESSKSAQYVLVLTEHFTHESQSDFSPVQSHRLTGDFRSGSEHGDSVKAKNGSIGESTLKFKGPNLERDKNFSANELSQNLDVGKIKNVFLNAIKENKLVGVDSQSLPNGGLAINVKIKGEPEHYVKGDAKISSPSINYDSKGGIVFSDGGEMAKKLEPYQGKLVQAETHREDVQQEIHIHADEMAAAKDEAATNAHKEQHKSVANDAANAAKLRDFDKNHPAQVLNRSASFISGSGEVKQQSLQRSSSFSPLLNESDNHKAVDTESLTLTVPVSKNTPSGINPADGDKHLTPLSAKDTALGMEAVTDTPEVKLSHIHTRKEQQAWVAGAVLAIIGGAAALGAAGVAHDNDPQDIVDSLDADANSLENAATELSDQSDAIVAKAGEKAYTDSVNAGTAEAFTDPAKQELVTDPVSGNTSPSGSLLPVVRDEIETAAQGDKATAEVKTKAYIETTVSALDEKATEQRAEADALAVQAQKVATDADTEFAFGAVGLAAGIGIVAKYMLNHRHNSEAKNAYSHAFGTEQGQSRFNGVYRGDESSVRVEVK